MILYLFIIPLIIYTILLLFKLYPDKNSSNSSFCFKDLKWPNCKPNNTTIIDCNKIFIDNTMPQNGLKPKYKDVKCCLSSPMYKYSNMKIGNCPYGWTNNPQNSNEWCTDKVNFFWPNQIRHKCYPDPNFKV